MRTQVNTFSLTMEKRLSFGPCFTYKLNVDSNGKALAERNCQRQIEPDKCNNYESNGISVEKRPCFKDEVENVEKQLSNEEIEKLRNAIVKSEFFSFEDDYGFNSKNCYAPATDLPTTILSIKSEEKEKTITHYKGCFVKQIFSQTNGLQPLTNLENIIDEVAGTMNWIEGK
jgi:hypothetical protein